MDDSTRFHNRSIDGAVFQDCSMARSLFDDVNLSDAIYSNVDLQRASFRNINLAGVSIDDANIEGLTIFGHDVQALIRQNNAGMAPTAASGGSGIMAAEPQLFVSDIDTACRFYVGKLGFRVTFFHGEPAFYAQICRSGCRLNLRSVSGQVFDSGFRDREADALSATLTIDDTRPLFLEFKAAGVDFHQLLEAQSWGALTFIVRDPDGNLIAFAGGANI